MDTVLDDKVLSTLSARISENIKPEFRQMLTEFRESVQVMIRELFEAHSKTVREEHHRLMAKTDAISLRVDALENEQRQDYLVLHGLSTNTGSSTTTRREDIIAPALTYFNGDLGLAIDERDIALAYRLPSGQLSRPSPTVLKFSSRKVRDSVFNARRSAKSTSTPAKDRVYINEYLTKMNSELSMQARTLLKQKKITRTWTMGGHVFIRVTDKPDEKPIKVTKPGDFDVT